MDRKEQRTSSSWDSWGNHVLTTLEKLEEKVDKLEDRITAERLDTVTEIVTLKTKAGIWGSVAGIFASLFVSIVAGFLVYNLTVGSVNKQDTTPIKPQNSIGYVLPPRSEKEDPIKQLVDGDRGNIT